MEFQREKLNIIQADPLLLNGAPKSWLSGLISQWMERAPGDSCGSTIYANLEDLKSAVSKAGFGVVADGLSLEQGTVIETNQSNVSNDNKRKSTMTEGEPNPKKPRLVDEY